MIQSIGNININNLNICLFNAHYYETYLFKLNYYGSTNFFINYEYNQYLQYQKKILSMLYYKSFDKYLIQQLNNNIKNDFKEKFLENNIPLDKDIMDSMKKTLKTKILLFTQKQFHLLIKYLSFGKEKIY